MTRPDSPLHDPGGEPAASTAGAEAPRGPHLLAAPARFAAAALVALTLSRLALTLWVGSRLESPDDLAVVLRNGLRMDLILVSYALAPAVLLTLVAGGTRWFGTVFAQVQRLYLTFVLMAMLLFEGITPSFIVEFDHRPDRLFLEYLVHPSEVAGMLLRGYTMEVIGGAVGGLVLLVLVWRFMRTTARAARRTSVAARVGFALLLLPAIFLGARSSLEHRPANPSSVAFSTDHLLNDLCLSSLYSVAYAAKSMGNETDAADVYGSMPREELIAEIRRCMPTVSSDSFLSDTAPTLHHQTASRSPKRPPNLVLILEESLGAQFVGALGGEPVTLFLDTLRDEGWWFDRMYATGTRSARGIEAVVAGFPPSPARSTVKLGLSQSGFFTLAEALGREGYRTRFIYGGESHFDNMKRFFTGNGFREIVELKDFDDPLFLGSWGVCDQDILRKAHESLEAAGDEPIFVLAFSVSNHTPWEYPLGGFEQIGDEPATGPNSVRYADFALKEFFELARASDYYDNTVFAVIADHDARVFGASLVPIKHFHIPAVILGAGVDARVDQRLASQIDFAPTLLSLLGVSCDHPMIGHDLTELADDDPGRAIMQYGANQAYMTGERAVVHQPHLPAAHFRYVDGELVPADADAALERRALANALLPSMLYRERIYSMPPVEAAPPE